MARKEGGREGRRVGMFVVPWLRSASSKIHARLRPGRYRLFINGLSLEVEIRRVFKITVDTGRNRAVLPPPLSPSFLLYLPRRSLSFLLLRLAGSELLPPRGNPQPRNLKGAWGGLEGGGEGGGERGKEGGRAGGREGGREGGNGYR